MRFPAYILSIYIVILAVLPCCLVDKCQDEMIKTEQAKDHKKGDAGCGSCSPFFNCEGCASAPATVELVFPITVFFSVKLVYTPYLFTSPHDVFYDVWQPPRLG